MSRHASASTEDSESKIMDKTMEVLAKIVAGSHGDSDPEITALFEAKRAKLGVTEALVRPVVQSRTPGLGKLAKGVRSSRVSPPLPPVTCPSPFHPHSRIVQPACKVEDTPPEEYGRYGLSSLACLASRPFPHESAGWKI